MAEGKATRRITRTVLSVDRKGASTVVAIKEEKPPLKSEIVRQDEEPAPIIENHVYLHSRDGVFLIMRDLDVLDPPCCVVRLPLKAGDAWEVNCPTVFPAAIKCAIGNEEEVEVPAGRFKAVRIDKRSVLSDGKTVRATDWVVPGMGAIKSRALLPDGTEAIQILSSFTSGKK